MLAPSLSVVITANGEPEEGGSYSLTCALRGDERLAVNDRNFYWDRVGIRNGISSLATLRFNPLSHDDEGEYRCRIIITSPYLNSHRIPTNIERLTINSKLVLVDVLLKCISFL